MKQALRISREINRSPAEAGANRKGCRETKVISSTSNLTDTDPRIVAIFTEPLTEKIAQVTIFIFDSLGGLQSV